MNTSERRNEPIDINEILAEIINNLKAGKDNRINDRTRKGDKERGKQTN